MATFITSKTVGEIINIYVKTSTGYWKYNHNGSDSSLLENTENKTTTNISITNVNGEFTIIPCDLEGNVTGNITQLRLEANQLTSFDGTGLSSLTQLSLYNNQLTSLDGFILPTSLTHLDLGLNQLTSFDGTGLSSLTTLDLQGNQLTSFDGTGLSDLINLDLSYSPLTSFIGGDMGLITSLNFPIWNITTLTSFDGTGLSSLTILELGNNQLTSFDGTGLSSLTYLDLNINQLTSFDGTGLSSLTELYLINNLLTSFDGTGLSSLTYIEMNGNPFTPSVNNQILDQFNQIGLSGGYIMSSNGRTSASNADYDNLVNNLGWTFDGFDLVITPQLPTFITSKAVGDSISISVSTSTGYWKCNHDGSDSSVFGNGKHTISITNANGEFTTISCDSDGTVSGDVTSLDFNGNQLTSFDGTGLTSLTYLGLYNNPLTTFISGDMGLITNLDLSNLQLTSFDGTGLTSLTVLYLGDNQLTSFDGTGLSGLLQLHLGNNLLTSFDGTGLSSLNVLGLGGNQLTSFDGTGLSSLTSLYLNDNLLTSFDGTGLSGLTNLNLYNNQLTSFDGTGLTSLTGLTLQDNQLTSLVNNQILQQLNQNGLSGGEFYSSNGRTSTSNTDYDNLLNSLGWYFEGLDLITTTPSTFITSKAVDKTITINVQTSTGFWKYNHDGSDSSVFDQNDGNQTITVSNSNGEFTLIPCLTDGTTSGDVITLNLNTNQLTSFDGTGLTSLTSLNLNNNQLTSFDGTDLSGLNELYLGDNQLTSLDINPLNYLNSFSINGNTSSLNTSSNNDTFLVFLAENENAEGWGYGDFTTTGGRTSASNIDYDYLIANGWSLSGLDLPVVGNGKLRVKGFRPTQPQPWDGGTIYNIGAVVTHEGQTWNCIQYAPSGYGPFGGYIDVYWTL